MAILNVQEHKMTYGKAVVVSSDRHISAFTFYTIYYAIKKDEIDVIEPHNTKFFIDEDGNQIDLCCDTNEFKFTMSNGDPIPLPVAKENLTYLSFWAKRPLEIGDHIFFIADPDEDLVKIGLSPNGGINAYWEVQKDGTLINN